MTPEDIAIAKQNIKIQTLVAVVSVALFSLKFIAWYMTHSLAVYTDMMESIVNILAAFFGLSSLYFSAQPRDKKHPYGHGKVEFVSAAVEGAFITLAGVFIISKIFTSFKNGPQPINSLDVGILLIIVTAVVNYVVGYICIRKGRANQSLALVASGKHLQVDTYSTMAIIIGLILIYFTHYIILDAIMAAICACYIIYSGIKIVREAFAGIVDEYDPNLVAEVVDYLNHHREPNWIDLHNLRIIKYGRILHFDAHMTVPAELTVRQAHDELKKIEKIMQKKYGNSIEMFIHLDPSIEGFDLSQHVQKPWTVEEVTRRHGLFRPQ